MLGVGIFGSTRLGGWLWLIHVLSALLTGVLLCRGRPPAARRGTPSVTFHAASFPSAFVAAVGSGLASILSICAFVVLFYVIAQPLTVLPGLAAPAVTGCVELFSTVPLLPASPAGFVLAAGLSGWGGLSVLCQTMAALEGTGLPIRPCVTGKLLQGGLSAALAFALLPHLFP